MNRKEAFAELRALAEIYLSELRENDIPNSPIALVDDFGEWLKKWRDDQ